MILRAILTTQAHCDPCILSPRQGGDLPPPRLFDALLAVWASAPAVADMHQGKVVEVGAGLTPTRADSILPQDVCARQSRRTFGSYLPPAITAELRESTVSDCGKESAIDNSLVLSGADKSGRMRCGRTRNPTPARNCTGTTKMCKNLIERPLSCLTPLIFRRGSKVRVNRLLGAFLLTALASPPALWYRLTAQFAPPPSQAESPVPAPSP